MGGHVRYSDAELEFVRLHSKLPRRALHEKFVEQFGRDEVSLSKITALCKRRGWLTGRSGCFPQGNVPANKGKRMAYHPNSARTQYKPGNRSGMAAKNYKPVGTERMTVDGYVERKIHDGMPLQSRWRAVHLIRWEELHGALPEGYCLKCLSGDKANTKPSNWKAIPRALLPWLNGKFGRDYNSAPDALKPVILATAELEHAAREAAKGDHK
jgi:hypothetical protein